MNQAAVTRDTNPSLDATDVELTAQEFDLLRKIVYDQSRIKLADTKVQMLRRRVQRRMGVLGLDSVHAYCDCLRKSDGKELTRFIDEVTTNLTYFFREKHHFDYLKETVLPAILATARSTRLRTWSAGCSTGEEPYSLAIVLKEMERQFSGWDARILASDLSFDVLETCRRGIYDLSQIEEYTSPQRIKRWFRRSSASSDTSMAIDPSLRQVITFNQLNLFDPWPMKRKFDVIFCRNVMIYFDKPTKEKLVERFADVLLPGGHLFVGHSESIMGTSDKFTLVHKTTYRKKD